MKNKIKIGIIICDRYCSCAGGKCFRAMQNKEGAFSIYTENDELELVGYTSCGDCPGGNIEYTPEEMIKNGVQVIHLATGMVVGYPPCLYIRQFEKFIEEKYGVAVEIGTHPIPQKYYDSHLALGTWDSIEWNELIQPTLSDEETRIAYN